MYPHGQVSFIRITLSVHFIVLTEKENSVAEVVDFV